MMKVDKKKYYKRRVNAAAPKERKEKGDAIK